MWIRSSIMNKILQLIRIFIAQSYVLLSSKTMTGTALQRPLTATAEHRENLQKPWRISALFFYLKDILPVPGYMPRIVLIRSTGETVPLFRQRFVCLGFHGMEMPMILLLRSIQVHFWSRTETTAEGQDGVTRTFI